ncbi:MAG: HNH endonuclease [Acidobacteria bacterium]|nr:HNH endonuclease [Acidobacteriota bacterium]
MEPTLLLNATYEPLKVVDWRKAVTLWCQGKVEVIDVYEREVCSVSLALKLPSVIRLLRYITIKRNFNLVPFSRANIYARDDYTCQYCGSGFSPDKLTFDHMIPVRYGGRKDWENIVTACVRCNRRKGGRTPAEAGMAVIRAPRRPIRPATVRIAVGLRDTPESWRDYLYWNLQFDDR